MMKRSSSISINIVSVFIILTSLLFGLIGHTNAWFTDNHEYGILINVTVSSLNLKLYQVTIDGQNEVLREVFTNTKNDENEADSDGDTTSQYISLNGKIEPDESVDLNLRLKNEDKGETSVYLRFKFQLLSRGTSADTAIPITIDGVEKATASTKGFVEVVENGETYYYYKESSLQDAENALFAKNTEITLLESFTVPYSSFMDSDGNIILKNSETIYISLTIDESASQTF